MILNVIDIKRSCHRIRVGFYALCGVVVLCAAPPDAHAACASPVGAAGDIIWSSVNNAPAYCNNTDWVSFPRGTGNAIARELTATWDNPPGFIGVSDQFGNKLAVSGNLAVVGAHLSNAAGFNDAGIAHVFNTTTGALVATLNNPSPDANDYFGISVAISGNLAVVGAFQEDPGGVENAGAAYVFNATTGALVATLTKPTPVAYDLFGISVGISDNRVVVGAYHDDPGGVSFAGAAYVFDATSGDYLYTLTNTVNVGAAFFGNNVAIQGDYIAVSASGDDVGGVNNTGSVSVFNVADGSLVQKLANPNPAADDNFGGALALNGGLVAVGALKADVGGMSDVGMAYVFDAATGALISSMYKPDPQVEDNFGRVAIHAGLVLVGSALDDVSGLSNVGTAYIFDAYTGALQSTLDNPAPNANDNFGSGLALHNGVAYVGAFGNSPGGISSAGSVYVFSPKSDNAGCLDPAGVQGDILYNSSRHVLQYCNNNAWVAAGPYGDGGAGCLNPVGVMGDIIYNTNHNSLQYCEGNVWVGIGGASGGPAAPTGCDNIGDVCSDGSFYIGLSPADGTKVYMTDVAWETTSRWDENPLCYRCGFGDTGATSIVDGRANVEALRAYSGDNATAGTLDGFGAAKYCDNLTGVHGHDDWYLPAAGGAGSSSEINLIWLMVQAEGAVGGLDISGSRYWSSTEGGNDGALRQRFNDGVQSDNTKSSTFPVRCVRR